jgi:hypothetical protein
LKRGHHEIHEKHERQTTSREVQPGKENTRLLSLLGFSSFVFFVSFVVNSLLCGARGSRNRL